jgi:hypothetical protein
MALTLIDFGGKQDSNCKLLKNRLSAAWHQARKFENRLLGPTKYLNPVIESARLDEKRRRVIYL